MRIGRRQGLGLVLTSPQVSLEHAELTLEAGTPWLRDLASTNGTSVNGVRVDRPVALAEGDILHIAHFELRLGRLHGAAAADLQPAATLASKLPPRSLIERALQLRRLIDQEAVATVFQPIVHLPQGALFGYEVLSRGALVSLPDSPHELLATAEEAGLDEELATLFRRRALAGAAGLPAGLTLFLNAHPHELHRGELLADLAEMRRRRPDLTLVVEISESFVTSTARLGELRAAFRELAVQIAYDDFGAGQARINELAEVPADFLKFDLALLAGLAESPPSKMRLLSALVGSAHDLGMATIAEGIETPGDAAACVELGFTHAQGFHYGRPGPLPGAAAAAGAR